MLSLSMTRRGGISRRVLFAASHAVWMCFSLSPLDCFASLAKTGGMVLIAGVVHGDGGKCLALVLLKNRGYGFDCGCCPW